MPNYDQRLEALGYALDNLSPETSLFSAVRLDGNIAYVSGHIPMDGDTLTSKGKVPSQVSVEEATAATALCAANLLRAVYRTLGTLNRVEQVIRLTGYVNSDADFTDQHIVMNGASQLILDVFGEAGKHARTSLGLAQLPLGASVEVEMIVRYKK